MLPQCKILVFSSAEPQTRWYVVELGRSQLAIRSNSPGAAKARPCKLQGHTARFAYEVLILVLPGSVIATVYAAERLLTIRTGKGGGKGL